MHGVKVALGNRGMMVEAAQQRTKEWRALAPVTDKFHTAIVAWPSVTLDCPSMLWWLSPGEGWDAVT